MKRLGRSDNTGYRQVTAFPGSARAKSVSEEGISKTYCCRAGSSKGSRTPLPCGRVSVQRTSSPSHSQTRGSVLRRWAVLTCLVAGCGSIASGAQSPTLTEPPADRIDEILTQLQKRSDGLKDIRCDVKFVDDDRINLAKGVKTGRILFLITEPNPKFLIHFDKTEMDGVLGKQEWYLFDGRWLHQAVERIKQVTKQEIARPGEQIDMFDLETAPFPLPFGQKKETILRNFDVTLAAPAPADPPDTDHLVCTPKTESRLYRKYDRLDLFVHRSVHLPTRIVVTKNEGYEISTADFPDLSHQSINTGVREQDLARPSAWKKYKEVVEDLVPPDEPSP